MLAEASDQDILRQRGQVADRHDAIVGQRPARAGADAPQPLDGERRQEARSSPSGTTTRPSGLRRSEAILATSRLLATPTEIVSPTSSWTARLMPRAASSPTPSSASVPVRSRNASSIESGSTSGEKRSRMAITCFVAAEYFWPLTGTKIASGHSAPAVRSGIAERMPNLRASYEAVLTTPRSFGPAAADDDRLAAQLRVVALLDGREERVQVDVQDGRRDGSPRVDDAPDARDR